MPRNFYDLVISGRCTDRQFPSYRATCRDRRSRAPLFSLYMRGSRVARRVDFCTRSPWIYSIGERVRRERPLQEEDVKVSLCRNRATGYTFYAIGRFFPRPEARRFLSASAPIFSFVSATRSFQPNKYRKLLVYPSIRWIYTGYRRL